jgi:hypothetical protein
MAYHLFFFGLFIVSEVVLGFATLTRQKAFGNYEEKTSDWTFFYAANFVCNLCEIADFVFLIYLIDYFSHPKPKAEE